MTLVFVDNSTPGKLFWAGGAAVVIVPIQSHLEPSRRVDEAGNLPARPAPGDPSLKSSRRVDEEGGLPARPPICRDERFHLP